MGRKSFHIMVLVPLAVLLLAAPPAPAGYNILGNGSFETGPDPGGGELSLPGASTALAPWTVGTNTVFYVGGFWQASQGVRSLGLNNGIIRQLFTPAVGIMYQVSFDLAGDPTLGPAIKSLNLSAPGVEFQQNKVFSFDTTAQTVTNMGWATEQWNFWGSANPSSLEFSSNNASPQGGPALDNVVLAPVSAILQNGSFESADVSLSSIGPKTVPGGSGLIWWWIVGSPGIQFMINPTVWQASQGGKYSLSLNAPTGPGSISQDIPTIPGDLYRVSFDLAGDPTVGALINPLKTLRVSTAGRSQDFAFDTTGKTTTDMGWAGQTWTFMATAATTTLMFQSLNSGAHGPALDNVKVIHPANLVLNGSFEDGPAVGQFTTLLFGSAAINGWTVAGNGLDYIGSAWTSSQGVRSLDMNSTAAGSIEQTFLTTPGATYNVAFDLAGNPRAPAVKTLQVSAAGRSQVFTFDTTGKTLTNLGWTTQHFTFKAKWETTTLLFESLNSGDAGPALDNVRVTKASPLQGPYLLLLID